MSDDYLDNLLCVRFRDLLRIIVIRETALYKQEKKTLEEKVAMKEEKNFLNGEQRNPDRIKPMLEKIEEAWKMYPDLRLGQLLIDCAKKNDVFSIEDDKMFEKIQDFINN